ncbi:MAG: polynucleotide adenylyltransferase PcnB [Vicinamibacterales bacterium]
MPGWMTDPVIVPRAGHSISRREIDPDALKVLDRLQEAGHAAYLVGGGVRDLLLARRPKDFDIGTSAHPYQIKKLFRNCWIIGRRFRLAHVRFGTKTIEVATFRRHLPAESENKPAEPASAHREPAHNDPHLKHDNTFGTPEEDAFRRDFTINALFYDIATFSVIDYVGGLRDLRDGVVRSIGDPSERFQEDPVRMMRAIVMASRLGFRLDALVVDGIARYRSLMTMAAPARLIEEYYKVLRSGAAEPTFDALAEHRLLEPITPELQRSAKSPALRNALASLDAYRGKYETAPATLTNPILLGTLLVPLGLMPRRDPPARWSVDDRELDDSPEGNGAAHDSVDGATVKRFERLKRRRLPKVPILRIGSLPIARRDTERLRQVLAFQRRLADLEMSARAKRGLLGRSSFHDALTWIEIHGNSPGVLEHWRGFMEALGPEASDRGPAKAEAPQGNDTERLNGRRRRGRRRRGGRGRFRRPPE